MSFYSDGCHPRPGPIECNPLVGLNHRVAVNVSRILDSCIQKDTVENMHLCINERDLPEPVRFISAESTQTKALITDLSVTRIEERPTFARVCCDITVPLEVCFECAEGRRHVGTSQICGSQDVVLYVPGESVLPFEIVAIASCSAPVGTVVNGRIIATLCTTTIIKVVTDSDILIPTYGFAPPPPAVSFAEDVCRGFFELPLYPLGK